MLHTANSDRNSLSRKAKKGLGIERTERLFQFQTWLNMEFQSKNRSKTPGYLKEAHSDFHSLHRISKEIVLLSFLGGMPDCSTIRKYQDLYRNVFFVVDFGAKERGVG